MNMAFYQYTFIKQLKSVSTYVAGLISLIPIIVAFVLTMKAGNPSGEGMLLTSFLGFPLSIIFLSFKISQVFRDEIENKTILSFQSKPITRKQMVFQGIFVLLTWSLIFAVIGAFVPFVVASIKVGVKSIEYAAIVTLIELLLLSMVSIIGLLLSISLSGKAFVATMIGGFVVGFFGLVIVSMVVSGTISKSARVNDLETKIKTAFNSSKVTVNESTVNGKDTFTVSATSDAQSVETLEKIYSDASKVNNTSVYTVIAWFMPSVHWAQMWSAGLGVTSDSNGDANSLLSTLNSEGALVNLKATYDQTTHKITSISFSEERKTIVPTWFPFVLWIAIGGAIIPVTVRTISRKNIA